MPKKFIGIDIDAVQIRVAVAQAAKGGAELIETRTRRIQPGEEPGQALREAVGETSFGDIVATTLPAVGGFVRTLDFPFPDLKKIEAALPFELDSQIPVSIEEMIADFRKPRARNDGASVDAAAVRREKVAEVIRIFGEANLPLHTLDLPPFAYVAGLRGRLEDGMLAVIGSNEAILCLMRDGRVSDFRSLPLREGFSEEALLRFIRHEALSLGRAAGSEVPRLYLAGSRVDQQLLDALKHAGFTPEIPQIACQGKSLSADLIPAAALALRAALPSREREFNFLKGDFAPRSEWAGFRKRLIAAGSLAAAVLLVAGCAAYFSYAQKTARAEALKDEMVSIFRQTFPGVSAIVDVPAQMRSNLNQLRQKTALLGVGRENSALNLMREVSANIPDDIRVDVREMNYTGDQVRLEGTTSSFDAINRIASTLEGTPSVAATQISDAKMSMDGRQVDFRLTLTLTGAKEGS